MPQMSPELLLSNFRKVLHITNPLMHIVLNKGSFTNRFTNTISNDSDDYTV